jgi:predicted GH43/DUF377 family glycosyl hydrolase
MSDDSTLVRRATQVLLPDPRRIISQLYLPGQELNDNAISRADSVIERVLGMTDEEVATALNETIGSFADRHHDIRADIIENFAHVAHRLPRAVDVSSDRRELIGAFFTKEYAVEGAALFNPSAVAHIDQTGLGDGELRFIMSVRSVGEGHISSIEFRTGVLKGHEVHIDDPGRYLVAGRATPGTMSREFLRQALAERGDGAAAHDLLHLLPDPFDASHLATAIAAVEADELTRGSARAIIKEIRWIASCNYRLDFPHDRPLSERVLYPTSVDETHGMEDARFVRFTEDDGKVNYWATYTAYDGYRVKPHLIQTNDFQTFDITRLIGPAAKNKGMAMFPRRVNGQYLALSRWDRENISIASSPDTHTWGDAVEVLIPEQPWEFIQLGNCGSPIETPEGWLVITHGVGPMREYGIGAILLSLDEPTKVIGALSQPILCANEDERDGYTPNVVYSCGALLHEQTLFLPYGCSDASIRFAFVDVPELMNQLHTSW